VEISLTLRRNNKGAHLNCIRFDTRLMIHNFHTKHLSISHIFSEIKINVIIYENGTSAQQIKTKIV